MWWGVTLWYQLSHWARINRMHFNIKGYSTRNILKSWNCNHVLPYCLPSAPSVSYFHTLLHSFANLSSQNVKKLRSTLTKSCSALYHIHVVGLTGIFHLSLFSRLSPFYNYLSLASFTIPYTFFCLLWRFPNYFFVLDHIFWLRLALQLIELSYISATVRQKKTRLDSISLTIYYCLGFVS